LRLWANPRFWLTATATDRQNPLLTVVGGMLGARGVGRQRIRALEPDDLGRWQRGPLSLVPSGLQASGGRRLIHCHRRRRLPRHPTDKPGRVLRGRADVLDLQRHLL